MRRKRARAATAMLMARRGCECRPEHTHAARHHFGKYLFDTVITPDKPV
jgi:hypothetical protein